MTGCCFLISHALRRFFPIHMSQISTKFFVIVCKNFFAVFFSRRPELFFSYNPLIYQKILRKSMYQRCSNSGVSHSIKCNKETLEKCFQIFEFFWKKISKKSFFFVPEKTWLCQCFSKIYIMNILSFTGVAYETRFWLVFIFAWLLGRKNFLKRRILKTLFNKILPLSSIMKILSFVYFCSSMPSNAIDKKKIFQSLILKEWTIWRKCPYKKAVRVFRDYREIIAEQPMSHFGEPSNSSDSLRPLNRSTKMNEKKDFVRTLIYLL